MTIARPLRGAARRNRVHRSAAITFCVTALLVSALAIYGALYPHDVSQATAQRLGKRGLEVLQEEDLECRLVHQATDKCAFIKANCPDEEAGLFSYLRLYYCGSPTTKPFALIAIIVWLCLLFSMIGIAASDFFCINLSTIAHLLGLSESLAGVTFLAFGNGSPDVFSTFAAMSTNSGSLAVGELIGAASFITAVVAGAMAFVRPFKVARRSFVRDVSFFIIAASFSMAFLVDGRLYLWEAIAMVGLYIFYVLFVVIWHWWFNRRKKRKQAEAAARAHFVASGSEVAEFPAYHDVDEPVQDDQRPPMRRGLSADDISLLERAQIGEDDEESEAEEDSRKRTLGEINSEMRLARPRMRERSGTHNPVRPSLIGALEFRSVLSGLQRSGNIQAFPLHRRRSDDDRFEDHSFSDSRSMASEPASRGAFSATVEHEGSWNNQDHHSTAVMGLRSRAISAPDPSMIRQAAENVPTIDLLGPLAEDDRSHGGSPRQRDSTHLAVPTSPSVSISPPVSSRTSRSNSPAPSHARSNGSIHLTVPDNFLQPTHHAPSPSPISPGTLEPPPNALSPNGTTKTKPQKPILRIPSGHSAFSPQSDQISPSGRSPSIMLPSPRLVLTDSNPIDEMYRSSSPKPPKWWPSRFLPTPFELWATLFPTLCGWTEKNWWERLLGIVAAPSIFLLTITLPVVETEPEEEEPDDDIPDLTLPSTTAIDRSYASTVPPILIEPEEDDEEQNRPDQVFTKGLAGHGTSATVAASNEHLHRQHVAHETDPLLPSPHPHGPRHSAPTILSPLDRQIMQSPPQMPAEVKRPSSRDWNRWLVILQIFIAPFFIALIFWAKMHMGEPRELIEPVLIALVFSLVFLALILLTTSPTQAPTWRSALCFVGFIVSITWISTIADEVVGVLKSIGVILNISDAILGLTIFAVGNSLGDLVADYTVAKLGYPVMALSACFGGPMLNILLGVGLSGTYLTIKHARKHQHKHPGRELKFKPYEIEVSRTLMISGGTLLFTLLFLLVVVPIRRWKMDRFVGWCLVALWGVSTVCNVIVEVLGVGANI